MTRAALWSYHRVTFDLVHVVRCLISVNHPLESLNLETA
jgi:hypothetical protein